MVKNLVVGLKTLSRWSKKLVPAWFKKMVEAVEKLIAAVKKIVAPVKKVVAA